MKIAVFSDIHDNLTRWEEAAKLIATAGIEFGICCGDVTAPETLTEVAKSFKTLYLALGNGDFRLAHEPSLVPKNVKSFAKIGAFSLDEKKIAIVHYNQAAEQIAESGIYDLVFYGHTHTPWEKKVGPTILLNPGEVSGQFGPASFCIYDLTSLKGHLKLLK